MARGQQDLVPRNLPYGGRQKFVQASKAAGVPLASGAVQGASAPPGRGVGPGQVITPDMDIFDYGAPANFAGEDLSPQGRQAAAEQQMTRIALESPNPLARAIAATWLRRRQQEPRA